MYQANFFAKDILTNVSFLNIENIPLFAVPHMTSLLVYRKGHKFGIFSIAYEENEDLYKISSKKHWALVHICSSILFILLIELIINLYISTLTYNYSSAKICAYLASIFAKLRSNHDTKL